MARQTGQQPTSRARREARSQLRTALAQAERVTRSGGILGTDARDALRNAAIAAAPLSRVLTRRLSRVMSMDALRTREEPRDELRGLTDDVMRITDGERFARARMSGTYLDVPESLLFWRRVAFGATCVLVLGVLWSTQAPPRNTATRGHGNSALEPLDPRNQLRLLVPFKAKDASAGGMGRATMTPAGSPAGAGTAHDVSLPGRFGHGPASRGTPGLEVLGSGGNVFFIDPSGRTRLWVGFGVPRPGPLSSPELPERN